MSTNYTYTTIRELTNRISQWDRKWPLKSHNAIAAENELPPKTGGIYIYSNNRFKHVVKIGVTKNFYSRLSDLTKNSTLPKKDTIY